MSEVPLGTPATGTARGLMGRVHGIETGYLNLVRLVSAILVGLGVLAVVGAILWYVAVHLFTSGTPGPGDYFEVPAWESIRGEVLPTPAESAASNGNPAGRDDAPSPARRPVDGRIDSIAGNLNAQFNRNPGHETGFTDRYPRRLLEAWAFEESGIPQTQLDDYIDRLISFSEAVGTDPQIDRIGSMDDRARVIMNALDAFRLAYLERVEQARDRAAAANRAAAERRAAAAQGSIALGLGGLGLLVSLLLIVVLLRIEAHLHNQTQLQALAHSERQGAGHGAGTDG